MKKTLLLLLPIAIFAQSFLISNIQIPKTYIQDLDPYECNSECLQEFLDRDMIFSFLAHANSKLENSEQDEIRVMNISILNLGSGLPTGNLRIALLLPYKKIGKYASSTTNASFAYLMTKGYPFELKSYKIESEGIEDLEAALREIKNDGFNYVIAPLTQTGVDNVVLINKELNIYFPTVNKKDTNTSSPFLSFGGIDYRAQSDILVKEAVSPLVIFSDKSSLGKKLALYEEDKFKYKNSIVDYDGVNPDEFSAYIQEEEKVAIEDHKVIKYSISRKTTNLERYLKENKKIVDGSFFLNTPIVKSGMIMSQVTLYESNATNILSTQINYDPLIISMTQYTDRKNMIIANSITEKNNVLIETNSLLGNDIVYDWINYTTTVGIDYFFSQITNEGREYQIVVEENQMIYPIELVKPSLSRFVKYVSTLEERVD